jgi:predicted HTH transcriptional regulator
VAFAGQESVRVGSHTKQLKDTALEPQLWRIFDTTPFEQGVALSDMTDEAVIRLLDCASYFDGVDRPSPTTQLGTLEALATDKLIRRQDTGCWSITNLGAALFAKRLSDFPTLACKVVRVIHYNGNSRIESANEQLVDKGYASGFEELISIILAIVPVNEALVSAIRTSVPMYPPMAIRELIANALIHQDFSVTGAGPTVEIFQNREP